MALHKITATLDAHSGLTNEPNIDTGISASDLKARYDRDVNQVKTDVNTALTEQDVINADTYRKAETYSQTETNNLLNTKANQNTTYTKGEIDTLDGQNVKLTGNQSIADVKTFTSSPIVPTPTTDMQTSTKKYVDDTTASVVLGQIPDNSLTDVKLSGTAGQIKPRVAQLETDRGTMASLNTTTKTSIVGAINEVNTGLSNAGGKTDNYYTTTSSTGNIGALVLDGTDDYATVPASVGQLTNGTSPFELVVKFNLDAFLGTDTLLSKTDTAYSSTTSVKGWRIELLSSLVRLISIPSNGASAVSITGSAILSANQTTYVKLSFDGTTVILSSSTDGISYTIAGTSTDLNLITGLSISDNVDTQIGRLWGGSAGFAQYFDGTIYSIQLTKSGVLTNSYEFKNFGTNQTITDSISAANGTSANGAVQGVSVTNYTLTTGKFTALTDNMRVMVESNATASQISPTVLNYVPTMTSDTLPNPFIALANTTAGVGYEAYRAFDNSNSTFWFSSSTNSGYVQIKLDKAVKCNKYVIRVNGASNYTHNPKDWTLQGSQDGSSWTTVDTETGYIFNTQEVEFTTNSNTIAYLYYRLNVTAVYSVGGNVAIQKLQLSDIQYDTTTTEQPAINIDSLGAKQIIGGLMQANKFYELRYDSSIDNFVALAQEDKKVIPTYVLPAAATSFTITNLDINRDGGTYIIDITNLVGSTNTTLSMYINNDTTVTNYYYGTTLNATGNNNTGFIGNIQTTPAEYNIILKNIGGYTTATGISTIYTASGVVNTYYIWEHKSAQSNVTSITFTKSTGGTTINSATVNIYKR